MSALREAAIRNWRRGLARTCPACGMLPGSECEEDTMCTARLAPSTVTLPHDGCRPASTSTDPIRKTPATNGAEHPC